MGSATSRRAVWSFGGGNGGSAADGVSSLSSSVSTISRVGTGLAGGDVAAGVSLSPNVFPVYCTLPSFTFFTQGSFYASNFDAFYLFRCSSPF